ncbi:MAG TPA: 2'-5' RNA ligase family protein [Chitinophagaceae bacterium]|nr:2'-5' RNA ligase family protein [Chitinophagaceae bacterium]
MEMYFIALVAPEKINEEVLKWKLWMQEKFQCQAALKSPAHITLIPPFWMHPELETELLYSITEFSLTQHPFPIQLTNFSCFKPRVLYVDVEKNEALTDLKNNLESFLIQKEKFHFSKEDRSFHPHVTIATRDLRKKAFYEAWEHLKKIKYTVEWYANSISVLKHNKKNWDVLFTSQFNPV